MGSGGAERGADVGAGAAQLDDGRPHDIFLHSDAPEVACENAGGIPDEAGAQLGRGVGTRLHDREKLRARSIPERAVRDVIEGGFEAWIGGSLLLHGANVPPPKSDHKTADLSISCPGFSL